MLATKAGVRCWNGGSLDSDSALHIPFPAASCCARRNRWATSCTIHPPKDRFGGPGSFPASRLERVYTSCHAVASPDFSNQFIRVENLQSGCVITCELSD